jgi:hypothetical protein
MLKILLSIALLIAAGTTCSAQSLFFDSMKTCVWITEQRYDEPTIKTEWDIFLQRWTAPVDSLTTNGTIWTFGDDLTLHYYNAKTKQEKPIKSYEYHVDKDKGRLTIDLNEKEQMVYEVGITSTGNTAGLYKVRREKKNGRNTGIAPTSID